MDKNMNIENQEQYEDFELGLEELLEDILCDLEDDRREFICKPCKRRNTVRTISAVIASGVVTAAAIMLILKNKKE